MRNNSGGFSLVEVAIAIFVISLVVTFSLKGRELIHTARLRSVIEQVETFRIAADVFTERYGALPGDLANASELIDSSLANGRGDGRIESTDDAKRFWAHLVKSGTVNIQLVNGYPISRIGGYFSVSSKVFGKPGLWLVLSGGTSDNRNFFGVITPADAYFIDKTIDDGAPNSGDVQIIKGQNASAECASGSRYNFRNTNEDCVILFKIR